MFSFLSGATNDLRRQWLLRLAIVFFILFVLSLTGSIIFKKKFQGKIYPNLYVGGLNLGGKTAAEASQLLNAEIDKINQREIIFSYKGRQSKVKPVVASADGSLAYPIINFDTEQTVSQAFALSAETPAFFALPNFLPRLLTKKQLPLTVSANQAALEKILKDNFSWVDEPAKNAELIVKKSTASTYEFAVSEEKFGKIIDYEEAVARLLDNLAKLDLKEIELATITQYPKILARDCLNIDAQAGAILNSAPLTLKYQENKWVIERDELAGLLALKLGASATDKIKVGLGEEKFQVYLTEKIAPKINQKPQEAKFRIANGKVSEFQDGRDGLELDSIASLAKIEKEIAGSSEFDLAVKILPVLTKADSINDLGIKEIIGAGTSNFAGSPANRRHNIKVGATAVNGTLVKPGEEFSLLKTLGEVASTTGYLPELVIKEGKTTPEYGGGLCQIGTTVFRAVVASGLPVTMRQNHSYRVSYYEPAGTDATIYDPWPDFRFINDTANHVLIQARFSGDNLSFEFWGTRDGRGATSSRPVIYNIVKPEPAKLIETLDLKPGEKKCTETAHNGADAYFDYKVTYLSGEVKTKRFSSHYAPWQEVCLLGVEKLSEPPALPAGEATSTPPVETN